MKGISVYVLEFMFTLAKMQKNSTFMWKKFEIWAWSILKVIQAFHTVRILLYIRRFGPVIGSLIGILYFIESKHTFQNINKNSFILLFRKKITFFA